MNKEIKHLYQELSISDKEHLLKNFEQSPKMILYVKALEESNLVTTQKAVKVIYEVELDLIEDNILINRFYKLRNVLRLYLLNQLKNRLKSFTNEETELKFLRLLLLKNEYAYVLERAKKLEKICWKDNLFELLPELMSMIISALHLHKSRDIKAIAAYVEKLDTANELLYALHKFENSINSFRLKITSAYNQAELAELYNSIITKIRRKAKALKSYPRFNLIYHYVSFSVGGQLQNIVYKTSNVLTRHLNQLDKLLAENPNMPIIRYVPNHRFYDTNSLLINKAVYWFNKQNTTKSYQHILKYEQLKKENEQEYSILSGSDFHNILLCCWAAKDSEAILKYSQELKEFQLSNSSVKHETPYYVYQLLAYIGLYPRQKCPNPTRLILITKKFLADADENSTWIYGILGTFTLLYGFHKESRMYLEHPPLIEEYNNDPHNIQTLDLLNAVESKEYQQLINFLSRIKNSKKQVQSQEILFHLNELEMLTKLFL
jgi:hypothetical protein